MCLVETYAARASSTIGKCRRPSTNLTVSSMLVRLVWPATGHRDRGSVLCRTVLDRGKPPSEFDRPMPDAADARCTRPRSRRVQFAWSGVQTARECIGCTGHGPQEPLDDGNAALLPDGAIAGTDVALAAPTLEDLTEELPALVRDDVLGTGATSARESIGNLDTARLGRRIAGIARGDGRMPFASSLASTNASIRFCTQPWSQTSGGRVAAPVPPG